MNTALYFNYLLLHNNSFTLATVGRYSSVGIATRYRLDSPGIEARWTCNLPHLSRIALGVTQPPLNWCRVSYPGVKRPGRGVNHPHLSSVEFKERVQLYLYSICGHSWSVLGKTSALPLPYVRCQPIYRHHHLAHCVLHWLSSFRCAPDKNATISSRHNCACGSCTLAKPALTTQGTQCPHCTTIFRSHAIICNLTRYLPS